MLADLRKLSGKLARKRTYFGAVSEKNMRQIDILLARFFPNFGVIFPSFSAHKSEKTASLLLERCRELKKAQVLCAFLCG